jgi:hypothetical protein
MGALQGYIDLTSFSLSTTTATTVVYMTAPANQRVRILGWGFFFDGTSNSAQPVTIDMGILSSLTGSYTAFTPLPNESDLATTFQSTCRVKNSNSGAPAEPVYNVRKTITVHPQLGYEFLAPLGQEFVIGGGLTGGWRCAAPATVNIRGYVLFEEG